MVEVVAVIVMCRSLSLYSSAGVGGGVGVGGSRVNGRFFLE